MTSRAIQVTALAVLLAAGTIDVACAQARGGMAGTLRGNPAGTLRGNPAGTLRGNPAGTLRGNPAGTLGGSRGTTGMGVRTSPNRNMNSGTFDGR